MCTWERAARLQLALPGKRRWQFILSLQEKKRQRDKELDSILRSCSHAACRLLCLQEEEDILWYHSHQKNESNVSAARQRGITTAGANSATASGTSHEDGVEGRDKHQQGAEAGAASPKALATPLPFPGLERVCCIPKERWAQPCVGSLQLTGVLWKSQSWRQCWSEALELDYLADKVTALAAGAKGGSIWEYPQPSPILTDTRANLKWLHSWVKVWHCL